VLSCGSNCKHIRCISPISVSVEVVLFLVRVDLGLLISTGKMHEQENHVDRDQVPQQPMIGLKKVTRKDKMALRLQQAYRCRMGRRILRRFQKLKVFRLETIAGITLQCFFRLKLAQKAGMHRDSKESCVCVRVCVSCYTHVPRA